MDISECGSGILLVCGYAMGLGAFSYCSDEKVGEIIIKECIGFIRKKD
jgi:hypothetical protein